MATPLAVVNALASRAVAVRDAGDGAIFGDEVGRLGAQTLAGCGFVDAILCGVGNELAGEALLGGGGTLLLEEGNDFATNFSEGLHVRCVFCLNLEDMVAELGFDHVRGLSGRE